MQRYRLKNNSLEFPNQNAPDWNRVLTGMAGAALTPSQARRAAPGTTVRVTGTAQPGDAGPQIAPISGQPCVWYRCYVQYGSAGRLQELPPAARLSDTMLVARPVNLIRTSRNAADEVCDQPFRVVDPDGGHLTIDPRIADVNSDVVTRNRVVSSRLGLLQQLLVEWIVPVGAPVVALSTVAPGTDLDASDAAFQFVSTRPPERIIERAQAGEQAGSHDTSLRRYRSAARTAGVISRLRTGMLVFFALLVLALLVLVVVLF